MSTTLTPVITNEGITALIDAKNRGMQARITQVAVGDGVAGDGSGPYTATADMTALRHEIQRVIVSGGEQIGSQQEQLHLTATIQDEGADVPDVYPIYEIGFFLETGELFAVYASPDEKLAEKVSGTDFLLAFDLTLTGADAGDIVIDGSGQLETPAARDNLLLGPNTVKIHTQAEFDSVFNQGADTIIPANSTIALSPIQGVYQPSDSGRWQTVQEITAFADSGAEAGVKVTCTSAGHGLSDGAAVRILQSQHYDGSYDVSNVTADSFDIRATFIATGSARWVAAATGSAVSAFADSAANPVERTTCTATGHGLSNNTTLLITQSCYYNGVYTVGNVSADSFDIDTPFIAGDINDGAWGGAGDAEENTFNGRPAYILKNSVVLSEHVSIIGFNQEDTLVVKNAEDTKIKVAGSSDAPVTGIRLRGWSFDGRGNVDGLGGTLQGNASGGAFYLDYCESSELNCKIINHNTSANGGGVYGANDVKQITATKLHHNSAANGGGVYGCDDSTLSVYDCHATASGSGIHSCDNALLRLFNCQASSSNGGVVVEDNSSVGIGTASPQAPLHIEASGSDAWSSGLYVHNDTDATGEDAVVAVRTAGGAGGTPYISWDMFNIAGWSMGMKSDKTLNISAVPNDPLSDIKFTIQHDGNIGIGTSSPAARLSINGGVHVGGDSDPGDDNLLVDGALEVQGETTLNGNVGIGTTTNLDSDLTVYSSVDNRGLTLKTSNNTFNQGLAFRNAANAYTWYIHRKDVGGDRASLVFAGGNTSKDITALTERMLIDKDGNVGIGGATTANTNLTVHGAAAFNDNLTFAGNLSTAAIAQMMPFVIRGTGNNNPAYQVLKLGEQTIYDGGGRGLKLTVINKAGHSVASGPTSYDTYADGTAANSLAAALHGITADQIGILTSFDSWCLNVSADLESAFTQIGLYQALNLSRQNVNRAPYAAIFEVSPSMQGARVVESYAPNTQAVPYAELRGWLADGSFVTAGNQPNALVGANANGGQLGVFVDHTGNVGIGTASPDRALSIRASNNELISLKDNDGANQWHLNTNAGGSLNFAESGVADHRLYLQSGGNVGIGTPSPAARLSVNGGVHVGGDSDPGDNNLAVDGKITFGLDDDWQLDRDSWQDANFMYNGSNSSANFGFHGYSGSKTVNVIVDGRLGIGITGPDYPLHVASSVSRNVNSYGYLNPDGRTGHRTANGIRNYSIYAAQRIKCAEFNAVSDARIKQIAGVSDQQADLATLLDLEVTNYHYTDTLQYGDTEKKGLIAQQVERVFPQAVQQAADFIPDIFTLCSDIEYDAGQSSLTVHLPKAHELQAGDKIRLIVDEQGQQDKEVIAVSDDACSFTVGDWKTPVDQIFVYGKQVDDFRTIDHDRILMLSISAIQAHEQRYQQLQKEKSELEAKVDRLEQGYDELKAEIIRLLNC